MRVILVAMPCPASTAALQALLDAGHEVAAIVLPAPGHAAPIAWSRPPGAPRGLPLAGPPTVTGIAARAGIPVALHADPTNPDARALLAPLGADAFVVACYPRRLPASFVAIAPRGGINIHPSALPALRGPEPLFHALRLGLERTAVTVHVLTARFDAGPILAKAPYDFPPGARLHEIEAATGALGGALAAQALDDLAAGRAHPVAQDERLATAAPIPTAADFRVPTAWSARRAYAFVRAVAELGGPLRLITTDGGDLPIRDAFAWAPDSPDRLPPAPPSTSPVDAPFAGGWVRFFRK